jgi:hypothetical protein
MSRADHQQEPLKTEAPDEFVSFAREYLAGDFPNPERKGCPPRAALDAAINSGKLPDDSLRTHLFGCSQCFSLYQQLLETRRAVGAPVPFWRRASEFIFARRVLIMSTASVVLVAVVSAVLFINLKTSQNHVTSADGAEDVTPPVTRSGPEPESMARIDLRLAEQPLHVRSGTIAFAITLPVGSPAGAYSVSLLDASGKTIDSRSASSPDGKQLSTTLNLPENQKLRLCVSRAHGAPICRPISSL